VFGCAVFAKELTVSFYLFLVEQDILLKLVG
jgi:hypothetical protein